MGGWLAAWLAVSIPALAQSGGDTNGPAVVRLVPQGLTNATVSRLVVEFNEPIRLSTFTRQDIVITGPAGKLDSSAFVVTAQAGSGDRVFDVAIPPQTAEGTYGVVIGPDITDLAGNPMSALTVVTEEQFSATPTQWARSGSALWNAGGFLRLTPADGFLTGYAFLSHGQPLSPFRVAFEFSLSGGDGWGDDDGMGADGMAFVVAESPGEGWGGSGLGYEGLAGRSFAVEFDTFFNSGDTNGNHIALDWNGAFRPVEAPVTRRFIDTGAWRVEVRFDGVSRLQVTLRSPQNEETTLEAALPAEAIPNPCYFGFTAATGAGWANHDVDNVIIEMLSAGAGGAYSNSFTILRRGPRVLAMTPSGVVSNVVTHLDFTFDAPIAPDSFGPEDFNLVGPSAPAAIEVNPVSGNTWRVTLTAPLPAGTFTVKLGPGIQDLAGNALNQDGDATNGEVSDDVFTATLSSLLPDLVVGSVQVPPQAQPGQGIAVRWAITNQGNATATGPWLETVFVTDAAAANPGMALEDFVFDGSLAPGAWLQRTQMVVLPSVGLGGNVRFGVEADSVGDVVEGAEVNNTALAASPTLIPLQLTLSFAESSVPENVVDAALAGVLERNGKLETELLAQLTSSAPARLSVPATLRFEPGQASVEFFVGVYSDGVAAGDLLVLLSAAAPGYLSSTTTVTVVDTDVAALALASVQTNLTEGSSVTVFAVRPVATAAPLTVQLSSSIPSRLSVPTSVIIESNHTAVAFSALALDNPTAEAARLCTITAEAAGYDPATVTLLLTDDDVPNLQVVLAAHSVSEGAGPSATTGLVTRDRNSPQLLNVALSSSDITAARVPATVSIAPGQTNASFVVAAVDDALLDGTQTLVIRAKILDGVTGETLRDGTPDTLEVTDDDGQALRLAVAADVLAEGLAPATSATITRNTTNNSSPLVVALTSSDITEATIPSTVTISGGSDSASIEVATVADGVTDGSQNVLLTASAGGFASAQASIIVSDETLPDLAVKNLSIPEQVRTEEPFTVSFQVVNQGFVAAGSNFIQRVYLSRDAIVGDDTPLRDTGFTGWLPTGPGLGQSLQVRAPREAGEFWIVAVADADLAVSEISERNNAMISARPIRVEAAYSATVTAGLHSAPAGTSIPLNGLATRSGGVPAAFEQVYVHVVARGTRRILTAFADANGAFATTFQPLPGEAGYYTVAAAHPGIAEPAAQDSFTLHAMRVAPVAELRLTEAQSVSGSTYVTNLGQAPLTGLVATVVSNAPGFSVTATLSTNVLAGEAVMRLEFAVTAPAGFLGLSGARIQVSSTEGAAADMDLTLRVGSLQPRLVVYPSTVTAGMKAGMQRMVSFTVTNAGGQVSGPVNVLLPALPWLSVASGNVLPSLAPGQGAEVSLLLNPPAGLALGSYTGTMFLQGAGCDATVPYEFLCLSELVGHLQVTVADEYTYYAQGSPRVTNATIRLTDALTGTVVAVTNSAPAGIVLFANLAESYYELEVDAPDHTSYRTMLRLTPGRTNEVLAFLPREAVKYTWTVVPTEIEDRTRLVIETTFETSVPMPVITVEPGVVDLRDQGSEPLQVDLKITNHGLIAAQGVEILDTPEDNLIFQPLIRVIGDLPARSSVTVPATFQRRAIQPRSGGGDCANGVYVQYWVPCGPTNMPHSITVVVVNSDDCFDEGGHYQGAGSGDAEGGAGIGSMPGHGNAPSLCDPCLEKIENALMKCAASFLPVVGTVLSVMDCFKTIIGTEERNAGNVAGCIVTGLELIGREIPVVGTLLNIKGCVDGARDAGKDCNLGQSGSSGSAKGPRDAGDDPYADVLAPLIHEGDRLEALMAPRIDLLGGTVWFQTQDPAAVSNFLAVLVTCISSNSPDAYSISSSEQAQLLALPLPAPIQQADVLRLVTRLNRSMSYYAQRVFNLNEVPAGQNTDFVAVDVQANLWERAAQALGSLQSEGYTDPTQAARYAIDELTLRLARGGEGICARIRLRIEQEAVVARNAFRATLEIQNNTGAPLEGVFVEVVVRDGAGQLTTGLFGIRPPELSGLSAVDGKGVIAPNSTGRAQWTLIPTSEAAPSAPVFHFVSGTLIYRQNGSLLTIPLAAAAIEVLPNPRLAVHYFHERDVFSDDPFTDEIEPSQPFSLAVLVQNRGYGTARNLRITSAQPKIIENQKGLLIDFQIVASEVGGQPMQPSLTLALGDIRPGQSVVGRWLLKSTLQGLFTDYQATFEHLDDLGDPRLSLFESVRIHEMNHVVQADRVFDDGRPDFLVNDVPDFDDLPDTLWFSTGSNAPVQTVRAASLDAPVEASHLTALLTATCPAGWTYLHVPDPAYGAYRLREVRRVDGTPVGVGANAWITDRTFVGLGAPPEREFVLHMLDHNPVAGTRTYTLVYQEIPTVVDTTPPASSVTTLPLQSAAQFAVAWTGTDGTGGSGVAQFDVFVSDNGGPFTLWLEATPLSSAVFQGASDHTYAFYCVAVDQAGNRESAPTSPDTQTTTTLHNTAPTLAVGAAQTVDEGQILVINSSASDSDVPAQTLTFSLHPDCPTGVTVDPATGRMTWTTGETHGPGTNQIVLIATDNGAPPQSATGLVTVVVREVNTPPALNPLEDAARNEGSLLGFTASAEDYDWPPNKLNYHLGAGAPTGASINPTNGVFTWRPSETQGPSTNRIVIIVTDNGTPSLSATQTFTAIVRDTLSAFRLSLGVTNVFAGETNSVPILLASGLDLRQLRFTVDVPSDKLADLHVEGTSEEVLAVQMQPLSSNRTAIGLQLDPTRRVSSTRSVARLAFRALPLVHSAIVPLEIVALAAELGGGAAAPRGDGQAGRIIVVAAEPVLVAERAAVITIYGHPGSACLVERATNLAAHPTWTLVGQVPMSGRSATFTNLPPGDIAFYRAREAARPRLSLARADTPGSLLSLRIEGIQSNRYTLESTTNFADPPRWFPTLEILLTNAWQTVDWTNTGEPLRLFRLQEQ